VTFLILTTLTTKTTILWYALKMKAAGSS